MPALGFDPTPGDVGSITALASRYAEVAAEVLAVQAQRGVRQLVSRLATY